jgi:hypothetical protein
VYILCRRRKCDVASEECDEKHYVARARDGREDGERDAARQDGCDADESDERRDDGARVVGFRQRNCARRRDAASDVHGRVERQNGRLLSLEVCRQRRNALHGNDAV